MNKEKIYFDTSVPSAYFDVRTPERLHVTRNFWRKAGDYELYISTLVLEEIEQVSDKGLKENLLTLVDGFTVLDVDDEVESLADAYLKAGILPKKYFNDALHIAVAAVCGIKFLISWNFKHFVNVKTRQMVSLVNLREGYGVTEIIAPPEL